MEVGQTVIINKTGEYVVIAGKPLLIYTDAPEHTNPKQEQWYPVEISGKYMYFPESSLSTKEQKVLNILRQWKSSK